MLTGVPSDATGDLTLVFDDAETTARWSVIPGDDSASLAPADVERIIQRLRQAQSLSVRLGLADSAPATFEVAEMFETPIQANIDQCGNNTEPDWQPITAPQVVLNDAGGYYGVYYREWNDFKRDSHVQIWAIDDASPPDEQPFTLLMTCNSQTLSLLLGQVPVVGDRTSFHVRIDHGQRYGVPAAVYAEADGSRTVAFTADLARLQQGSELSFDIGHDQLVQGSFQLSRPFGTPIQANVDTCDRDYWAAPLILSWRKASMLELTVHSPNPFTRQFNLGAMFDIPIVGTFDECLAAPTSAQSPPVPHVRLTYDGDISFAAERLYGSAWITSFVDILDNAEAPTQDDAADYRSILTISCGIDGLKISIIDLDEMQPASIPGEQVKVTWEIEDAQRRRAGWRGRCCMTTPSLHSTELRSTRN